MVSLAIFVLRLGLGIIFTAHGLQKAFALFGGPGVSNFSKMLAGLGFVPALLWGYLAAYVELICGLFLIFGFMARISAALLFILIIIATAKVHLAKGFFIMNGGFEYNLLIACVCLALIILGPGKLSLARLLTKN